MAKAEQPQESTGTEGMFETDDGENFNVNFDNVEDQKWELIPRGRLPGVVESLEFLYSESKGNPMWKWELVIEGGDFDGRKLFFHTVFAGAGLSRTKKTLQRVCPDLVTGDFNPEKIADEEVLVGKKVMIDIGFQRYNKEKRNTVKDIYPGEDSDFLGAAT